MHNTKANDLDIISIYIIAKLGTLLYIHIFFWKAPQGTETDKFYYGQSNVLF